MYILLISVESLSLGQFLISVSVVVLCMCRTIRLLGWTRGISSRNLLLLQCISILARCRPSRTDRVMSRRVPLFIRRLNWLPILPK